MTAKYILNVVCSFIKVVAWITSLIVFIKDEALPIITFRGVDERPYTKREKRLPARVALKLLLWLKATSKDSFSRGVADWDFRAEMREPRDVDGIGRLRNR